MNLLRLAVKQPVTVAVGVILVVLAGLIALQRIPVQLTPNVEDTIIAVTTLWEGASPREIEQEIIDPQEEVLQGIPNLRNISSISQQGMGLIRLEFKVGTPKEVALREVSDKLREVPDYPDNTDEPVVEASDPDNRDFIAWLILTCEDPDVDVRTLQDFAEDRIQPVLERVAGMSDVNVLGGREREIHVQIDPIQLAQRGITLREVMEALTSTNRNVSGGTVAEGMSDVRLRLVNQYEALAAVEQTVVAQTPGGPVRIRDVGAVVESFKEVTDFVRSSGQPVIAINAQKEIGANVIEVMKGLKERVEQLNAPGGLLETYSRGMALNGKLTIRQVYDQTTYIDDALILVKNNLWLGGALAIGVLLVFLRSVRGAGIIALSIPISIVGAIAFMVMMGRSINVISLAGMAFAVGMVVDNAIVVLENIHRHLEMGKKPMQAALDGGREVAGAVLAATLTTVVVFIPVLLIEDEAGQLFRDIALAIVAAILLSLVVSLTVVPTSAARLLRRITPRVAQPARRRSRLARFLVGLVSLPDTLARFTYWMGGSVIVRLLVIVGLTTLSIVGTVLLMPPTDYLPQGNRNMVFGLLIPPPGYTEGQKEELARRIELTMAPYYEAGMKPVGSPEYAAAKAALPSVPTFNFMTQQPGEPVVPPPLENYFIVSIQGMMFHGGISTEPDRVIDYLDLFRHATRPEMAPGVLAFAFQVPLFQLGGRTGSAVKVNFVGDDLDEVARAALVIYGEMMQRYGPYSIQPEPSNFNVPSPELQILPDLVRLAELGLQVSDLAVAVQMLGDGAIIGDYRVGGKTIDLKVIAKNAEAWQPAYLGNAPIASPSGTVVPLGSVAALQRVNAASQINREGRQRAVTLQFTPPPGLPLERAVLEVDEMLAAARAAGNISPGVQTGYTGSASKLSSVQTAMLGDGSITGLLGSAMFLALLVVYLLLCVLFQSFLQPLIILFSVPLAALGGFAALFVVFLWSVNDPYLPIQNLDVLTMLGFVILIGVVVNNAILIVHQSRNFMLGQEGEEKLAPRRAIAEAVRSRVRPIFMSTMTSLGGMAPLVLMPGSGSELYRGLGSVVLGGLLVSTVFTLFLVPALLSLVTDLQARLGLLRGVDPDAASGGAASSRPRLVGQVLALLGLLTLPSCQIDRPGITPSSTQFVHAVLDEHLRRLEEVAPPAPPASPSAIEGALAGRMEELEAMAGPATLDAVVPALPPSLVGTTPSLRPVILHEVVASATEHNLGVRFSRLQPEIAAQAVLVAEADFDPEVYSSLNYQRNEQPQAVPVLGGITLGSNVTRQDRETLELGVQKRLFTGASITTSTFVERLNDRTPGFAFLPDPSYRSGVAVTATQPLLKGFGAGANLAETSLRENERDRTQANLRLALLDVMLVAEVAYWDLHESWQRLKVQQVLAEQGEAVERVLRERQDFDASPTEYSDALATVEQRRSDLVRARRIVADASDQLKGVLNDPDLPLESEALLVPDGPLDALRTTPSLREVIVTALRERPEIQTALLQIDDADIRTALADNQRNVQLDLEAGLYATGLGDELGSSYASVRDDHFYDALLGLSLVIPIGNRAAVARHRQAQLDHEASLLVYRQAVENVVLEVRRALRDVQTSRQLVDASKSLRIAQTENLRTLLLDESQRTRLTPEFLALKFQRQERLAQARLQEIEALTNFQRALAGCYHAMGTGLRATRLELQAR